MSQTKMADCLEIVATWFEAKVLDPCTGGLERLDPRGRLMETSQAKREPVLRRLLNDIFKPPTSWCGAQNLFEWFTLC